MTKKVILGIWQNAPFQGSIISSVDRLNTFLKEGNFDMEYDVMYLAPEKLSDKMTLPDVFILDGGEDVDPGRYEQRNVSSYFSKTRDAIEFKFAEFMAIHNVRMSGVCRGHQLLNVFLGGSLFQDIRREGCVPQGVKHSSGHKVKLGGGKGAYYPVKQLALGDFVGTHPFSVSSLHHQAVRNFGSNVMPSLVWEQYYGKPGSAKMGRINEGIETTDSMIRGVQCHPEFKGYAKDGLLFAYLMYVDYFSTPLMEVSDDEVTQKFKNLILKRKKQNKANQKFVDMGIRDGNIREFNSDAVVRGLTTERSSSRGGRTPRRDTYRRMTENNEPQID